MSDGRIPVRRRGWVGWTIGCLVVLLMIAIGWVTVRGIGAVTELDAARDDAAALQQLVLDDDLEATAPRLNSFTQHVSSARSLTGDPVWRAFEFVPWLGANFTAVREVAEVADDVAQRGIDPLLDVATTFDFATLGISEGRIDLDAFADIAPSLRIADVALQAAQEKALRIDAGATLPPLADAVRELTSTVSDAATMVGSLRGAAELLPGMLGGDGPRNYLLLVQNNAELRSSGGIVGALALLRANDGAIGIERQASTADFPPLDEPIAPLSDQAIAFFGDGPGRYIQNVTNIPVFAQAAPLAADMWEHRFGDTVDGVIAIDAVVAQYLLAATGPIEAGPFTLDEDNAVELLLSRVYAEVKDPKAQDAVFAVAAQRILDRVIGGGAEPQALIGALGTAAGEGRIRVWSAHHDEQAVLARTTLAGGIVADTDDEVHAAVYFNDTTGGKMDYYAASAIEIASGRCGDEARMRVTVTWSNDAPADAAETLPSYVTGDGAYGVDPGSTRTLISVFGPEGWDPVAYDRDGETGAVQTTTWGDRAALQHEVLLAPGETTRITVEFAGDADPARANVVHTPQAHDVEISFGEIHCG